jgi:hypothetical protein
MSRRPEGTTPCISHALRRCLLEPQRGRGCDRDQPRQTVHRCCRCGVDRCCLECGRTCNAPAAADQNDQDQHDDVPGWRCTVLGRTHRQDPVSTFRPRGDPSMPARSRLRLRLVPGRRTCGLGPGQHLHVLRDLGRRPLERRLLARFPHTPGPRPNTSQRTGDVSPLLRPDRRHERSNVRAPLHAGARRRVGPDDCGTRRLARRKPDRGQVPGADHAGVGRLRRARSSISASLQAGVLDFRSLRPYRVRPTRRGTRVLWS